MINSPPGPDAHARSGLAVVTASLTGSWASAQPPTSKPTLSVDINSQIAKRAEFGLDSSTNHIHSVLRGRYSMSELGIPLSAEETAEIHRRDGLPSAISAMQRHLTGASVDLYAGAWIDQAHGGSLHFEFKRGQPVSVVTPHTTADSYPRPKIIVDRVKFSEADLKAATAKINSDLDLHAGWVKYFSMSDLDTIHNRVVLTLEAKTPANVLSNPGAEFGESGPVKLELSNLGAVKNSRNHLSGPLYGGEWISNGVGDCTAGYGHSRGGPGDEKHYYLVTAGHCGNGRFYQGRSAAGNFFGSAHNNAMIGKTSSRCDCVAVGPLPASAVTNKVYTSNTGLYAYARTATSNNFTPGNKVCLSGATYADAHGGGIMCGTITSSSRTAKYIDANYTLKDGFSTSITTATSGDSGGPYGSGTTFMGIHAATLADQVTHRPEGTLASKSTAIFTETNTTPTY